jgi:hypothetical protein
VSSKTLTTYLNDHLAGSVAALELLDHLADLHLNPDRKRFFSGLRVEVEQDEDDLGDRQLRVLEATETTDRVPRLQGVALATDP